VDLSIDQGRHKKLSVKQVSVSGQKLSPTLTFSLKIKRPIKVIKSTNSEGSKCASKFPMSGGIKVATVGPAVANTLAKAKRV
jgi:hypothetical protein